MNQQYKKLYQNPVDYLWIIVDDRTFIVNFVCFGNRNYYN